MTDHYTEVQGLAPSEDIIAAEAAVLGAAIQSTKAAERMTELLRPSDFWKTRHQLVAEAIDNLVGRALPVTPVSVLNELRALGKLGDNLSGNHLHGLATRMSLSLDYDADIVAKEGERRRILIELSSALGAVSKPGFNAETDMDNIRERLDQASRATSDDEPEFVGDMLISYLDELHQPLTDKDRVPAPYVDLNAALAGGLRPGQFAIIGARPSVGKSLAALDFARHNAIKNPAKLPVLFISLEMSKKEVMDRLMSAETGIPLHKFIERTLNDEDDRLIARIQDRVFDAPILVDDRPDCTIGRIRARLRNMARTNPCRLLIVDYLTLMKVPHAENRERQVAELSRSLKLLAMEHQIPVLVLHQLNREPERRNDKTPASHDLRESGMIEADADVIMLLHRPDAHEPEHPRAGEIDIRLDKNRNGAKCVITIAFQGHRARLVNFERQPEDEDPTVRPHLSAVPD